MCSDYTWWESKKSAPKIDGTFAFSSNCRDGRMKFHSSCSSNWLYCAFCSNLSCLPTNRFPHSPACNLASTVDSNRCDVCPSTVATNLMDLLGCYCANDVNTISVMWNWVMSDAKSLIRLSVFKRFFLKSHQRNMI